MAPLPDSVLASPDTVLGAFIRDLEARIAEEEASAEHAGGAAGADDAAGLGGENAATAENSATAENAATPDEDAAAAATGAGRKGRKAIPVAGDGPADELRDALRLGRLLLSGVEVTL